MASGGISNIGDRLFETWADAADVALFVAGPDGTIEFANQQCVDLCGLGDGAAFVAAVHSDERGRLESLLTTLRETKQPVDFTAKVNDGAKVARFLISATFDDTDNVKTFIGAFRDVTGQSVLQDQLQYAATHDALTGVLSRGAIISGLQARLDQRRGTEIVALLFVDLDDFKSINDGYGHAVGDIVLKEIAERLSMVGGAEHQVGRMGGDEFLVVACDTSRRSVMELGQRLLATLIEPIVVGSRLVQQRLSIGIAMSSHPLVTAQQLMVDADLAMYSAKRTAEGIAVADNNTRASANRRLAIERDLFAAISNDLLTMHYQPICDLRTGEVLGAESLVRWNHPRYGHLSPPLIIERAEIIGVIDDLTRWMLDRVANEWTSLQRDVPSMANRAVSVNLTARQLNWGDYLESHFAALERYGMDPGTLIVEVVESSQIGLGEVAETNLRAIARRKGLVALDDFGVGYNALDYFTRFPVHELKIDRALVSAIDQQEISVILKGIVQIADALGTAVLAEGVETEAEARASAALGMAHGQGYWFGRPLPLGQFKEQLASGGFIRNLG